MIIGQHLERLKWEASHFKSSRVYIHRLPFHVSTVDGALSDIQLFQIIYNYLGNAIYETKPACVLYVFSRYFNVFYEIGEIDGILAFIIQEHVDVEFVVTVCIVGGTVLTQLNNLFLEFIRLFELLCLEFLRLSL